MDYGGLKRKVYLLESFSDIDALVIWTNIPSSIKGSIEALQSVDCVLSENEYLNCQAAVPTVIKKVHTYVSNAWVLYQVHGGA
jgi:hypothetical protein